MLFFRLYRKVLTPKACLIESDTVNLFDAIILKKMQDFGQECGSDLVLDTGKEYGFKTFNFNQI
jgi:hypothetical protein